MKRVVWYILLSVFIPSLVYIYAEIYNPFVYIIGTPVVFMFITYLHDSLDYNAGVRNRGYVYNSKRFNPNKNVYVSDWKDISWKVRSERGFVCEDCGVNLSGSTWLLHTHHRNRKKSDNCDQNLRALCVECHSNQPGHLHMKVEFAQQILQVSQVRDSQLGKLRIFV